MRASLRILSAVAISTFAVLMVAMPAGGAIIINEVDYDNVGTDTAEFIELYNSDVVAYDLTGHVLVLFNGAAVGDASYNSFALSGSLAAGDYLVVGNVIGADIDPATNTDLIQNGVGDAIGLYSSGSFPNGTAATTTNLVAGVVYEGQDSFPVQFELITVDDSNTIAGSLQRIPNGSGTFSLVNPPSSNAENLVPEPSTIALALASLGLLARRRATQAVR